jgi:hypothetical protein
MVSPGDVVTVTVGDIEAIRARARGANINEQTLLATDYLNHFNEAMMLLELVPNMPDCVADLREWHPISYEDHFRRSNFAARDTAIEAYHLAPDEFRKPFDVVIERLGTLLEATISGASTMIERGNADAASRIVHLAMPAIRHFQETAGAIINGAEVHIDHDRIVDSESGEGRTMDQSEIDSLMNG